MPSLVEIGPGFLRRKFLNFVNVFSLFRNYVPMGKAWHFIWTNLNSLHLRILCARICLKLTKKMKMWKVYWHTDRQTVILWNYRPHNFYYFRPFRPIVIVIIGQIPKEVIHVLIVSAVLIHYSSLGRIYKRGKNISKFKLDKKNQFITSNTSQVMFKLLMISYSF